jgi:hypothetical protein
MLLSELIGKSLLDINSDIPNEELKLLKFRVPKRIMDPVEEKYNEGFLVPVFGEVFISPDPPETNAPRRLYLLDFRHCDLTEIVVINVYHDQAN